MVTLRHYTLPLLLLLAGCSGSFAEAIRSGCLAGCDHAPRSQTSETRAPGPDPGRPAAKLSMVWLHHSTGDRLLAGGLRAAIKAAGVEFHDINYGQAKVDGYTIGDHTDPRHFPTLFNTPAYLRTLLTWEQSGGRHHDVVMFKSCYPASNIDSKEKLRAYRSHYQSLLPIFRAHPRVLFVVMSTPPLVRAHTSAASAARARYWARWLATKYARDLPNVQVFDLFDALAIKEGNPHQNTLAPQFAEAPTDSHPSRAGAQAVARLWGPWFNRAVRAAGLVK